jgi:Zn-dependent M28 family amino/carboxypeptidase
VAYNIVAEKRGVINPEEVVLVACHLDAFYAGADDNTSAVAAMLEIARAAQDFSFARTIRFVAFDLEEYGSVGSTRYILAGYADDVQSAVVMDLIGYASNEPGSQDPVFGVQVPDVGDYLFVIGNGNSNDVTQQVVNLAHTSGLAKTVGILAPQSGNFFLSSVFMRSDHGLLWYNGIPAVFFTDGANFRNPNYHKPSDLPETLNRDFLVANTKIIAATVAIQADIQP